MIDPEVCSWLFVYKEWGKIRRQPIPDKGFEESFREYIYRKTEAEIRSVVRDMGLGLSYEAMSEMSHELDVVCT